MGSGRSVGRRKASGTSAGEKRAERQPEKADKSSAGKSGRTVTEEKQAERQPEKSGRSVSRRKAGGASAGEKAEHRTKHPSAGTGGESEKSRRKNPAAFLHFRTAGGTPGDQ